MNHDERLIASKIKSTAALKEQVLGSLGAASLNLEHAAQGLERLGNVAFNSLVSLLRKQSECYKMIALFLTGEISDEEFGKIANSAFGPGNSQPPEVKPGP